MLENIKNDYAGLVFEQTDHFKWNPTSKTIYYNPDAENALWSLLHELGHMELGHSNYISDFSLLKMEARAWEKAKKISKKYSIDIDQDHIEKCLDSYRDWLYKRSKCRRCLQAGIEKITGKYVCVNCSFSWTVTPERFCRVYRKKIEPDNVEL